MLIRRGAKGGEAENLKDQRRKIWNKLQFELTDNIAVPSLLSCGAKGHIVLKII
jgi:hypothetical protein